MENPDDAKRGRSRLAIVMMLSALLALTLYVGAYVTGRSHANGGFIMREMPRVLPVRVFQPLAWLESRIRRASVEINDGQWYITCSPGAATQGCEGGED